MKNLKNVTPLALTKVGEEGSCTVLRVQLMSAARKKQHAIHLIPKWPQFKDSFGLLAN